MSRKIKFRAWQDGQMLTQPLPGIYAMQRFFGFLYEDTELMQSTGLKDKNGKEIFEGDIIKTVALMNDHHQRGATEITVVRYWASGFCLCLGVNESGVPIFPFNVDHEIEIIGNIHENPELLK